MKELERSHKSWLIDNDAVKRNEHGTRVKTSQPADQKEVPACEFKDNGFCKHCGHIQNGILHRSCKGYFKTVR